MSLGVDAVVQLAKAHVYLPADRLPVAAGRAELRRLRAVVAIGARDAERGDARVVEEKMMSPGATSRMDS